MPNEKLKITIKPLKGEDGHKTFSLRLRDELVDELDKICYKSRMNRNELIRMCIEYGIKNIEIEEYSCERNNRLIL